MFPTREEALKLIRDGLLFNPGPWGKHCLTAAHCAEKIAMEPSMESEKFILTDKPHSTVRKEGFPLDSISLDIKTNKYYYDLPEDKLEQVAVGDGFLEFFKNILNLN